jgi:hypothetical protein
VTQADIARAYQNAVQELNDQRQSVQGQPEPLADISELLREMQQLDPKRFPGNPAMVEELHQRVLATVDQLSHTEPSPPMEFPVECGGFLVRHGPAGLRSRTQLFIMITTFTTCTRPLG